MALYSCSSDRDPEPTPLPESVGNQLSFTLSAGSGLTTRLTNAPDTTNGQGMENYIDVNDIVIYIYEGDADDNSSEYLEMMIPMSVTPNDNGTVEVVGEVGYVPTPPFKVVAMVNWSVDSISNTEEMENIFTHRDIDNVCSLHTEYEYNYGTAADDYFIPSEETPIPMYGVNVFTSIDAHKGLVTHIGQIDLVRAMAKIEVISSKPDNKTDAELTNYVLPDITDVKLTRAWNGGYCGPRAMYKTTAQPTDANINIPDERAHSLISHSPAIIENLAFREVENDHFVIYVPEYRNVSTADVTATPAKITLTVNGIPRELEFKDYAAPDGSTQEPFNILRNHRYVYKVAASMTDLDIKCYVLPMVEEVAWPITFN